jgi:nitrate reductase NapE component
MKKTDSKAGPNTNDRASPADGRLKLMTKSEVTRILRIVFFLWLVVSIALVATTVVTLGLLPDQTRGSRPGCR